MKPKLALCAAAVVSALILIASVTSCTKKPASTVAEALDPAVLQAAQQLTDGTNILTALDQKEYESAVAGLAKLQPSAIGTEQESAYRALNRHVLNKLRDAAESEPKAGEAMNAMRVLIQGR